MAGGDRLRRCLSRVDHGEFPIPNPPLVTLQLPELSVLSATVGAVPIVQHDPHRPMDRCTTPDGLGIAVYDFGGQGADLLLVHATGFCAEVLEPVARSLGRRFRCWGLDLRAHGRSDRPTDGDFAWSGFCTDVLTVINYLGLSRPYGFGHSCGGAAVLLAEEAMPGTFASLYCFEPVVLDESPGALPVHANPLTEGARRRRQTFPSAEDAFLNFSTKPSLSGLDPEVLKNYVQAGFEVVPAEDGGDGHVIRLRCRRDDEAAIYANGASHGAFGHLHEIGCPVVFSCGELTDAFGRPFVEANAGQVGRGTVEVVPGVGHFGPLEQPGRLASSVLRAWYPAGGTPRS
jgi:pimeloyl-ACP methyl ester carboxylesterase